MNCVTNTVNVTDSSLLLYLEHPNSQYMVLKKTLCYKRCYKRHTFQVFTSVTIPDCQVFFKSYISSRKEVSLY